MVKSAFVPINPPAAATAMQEMPHPDSTVKEPVKVKCELMAPPSPKRTSPTPTRIIAAGISNKTVWRPY